MHRNCYFNSPTYLNPTYQFKNREDLFFAAIAAMVMVSVSNVFASSRMVSTAEVAPVDTVAPDAPSDTTEVGTPIQPQATTEDSTQQETTQQQATETEQQANAE